MRNCFIYLLVIILFLSNLVYSQNNSQNTILPPLEEKDSLFPELEKRNHNKYAFFVKTNKDTYKLGEKIIIHTKLENNSSDEVRVVRYVVSQDYKIEVKDKFGKKVAFSEKWQNFLKYPSTGSSMAIYIHSNKEYFAKIDIFSDMFDLKVGEYSVILKREIILKNNKTIEVKTKPLTFTIKS
jgi:hypothetical protein